MSLTTQEKSKLLAQSLTSSIFKFSLLSSAPYWSCDSCRWAELGGKESCTQPSHRRVAAGRLLNQAEEPDEYSHAEPSPCSQVVLWKSHMSISVPVYKLVDPQPFVWPLAVRALYIAVSGCRARDCGGPGRQRVSRCQRGHTLSWGLLVSNPGGCICLVEAIIIPLLLMVRVIFHVHLHWMWLRDLILVEMQV